MTLPSSGSLASSQFNVELGRSSTAQLSMSETRTLADVPSGALAFSNLYGKSSVTFDEAPGTYYLSSFREVITFSIGASTNVSWDFSNGGTIQTNVYNGSGVNQYSTPFTSNRITLETLPIDANEPNYAYWVVNASVGGTIIGTWYVTHEVYG